MDVIRTAKASARCALGRSAPAHRSQTDLDDACPHLLAQADDGCPTTLGPSLLRMTGLREGTVQIAVTTFGSPPTTPWPYVLHVRSDQSCE